MCVCVFGRVDLLITQQWAVDLVLDTDLPQLFFPFSLVVSLKNCLLCQFIQVPNVWLLSLLIQRVQDRLTAVGWSFYEILHCLHLVVDSILGMLEALVDVECRRLHIWSIDQACLAPEVLCDFVLELVGVLSYFLFGQHFLPVDFATVLNERLYKLDWVRFTSVRTPYFFAFSYSWFAWLKFSL